MHYDNPGLHGNVVDSSGLEVSLTPHLRKYDSGLLTVGHDVTSFHIIPPGEERFTTVGHCPEICTRVRNVLRHLTKPQQGCERGFKMFSESSTCLLGQHGSCSTVQRPLELSKNISKNIFLT